MKLLRDFRYRDSKGLMWVAKKGHSVDGASIPRLAWTVAGSPYDPPYRDASVIHDYYCDTMERTWEATHEVFLDAMLTSGTDKLEAYSKYYAVHRAGPRWDEQYRWSGLWPIKTVRPDLSGIFAPVIAPPPPPPFEKSLEYQAILGEKQAEIRALAESQFEAVRSGLSNGTLSPDDLKGLAESQINEQPEISYF